MPRKPRASAHSPVDQLTGLISHKGEGLVTFAASILKNDATAEDAVNTAFERAFQSLDTFKPGDATIETWFRRIIENVCIDELRAGGLGLGTSGEIQEDPAPEKTAPVDSPLSEIERGDPYYSGQGLDTVAVEDKRRRWAEKVDEMVREGLDELDHPIPDDWEKGLREAIEEQGSSCKATMLRLLNGKKTHPLIVQTAAILWRAYVKTPIIFREIRVGNLYPATRFTAILHGALWETAVGLSSHYTEMAKRAAKSNYRKIGQRRALLGLRYSFERVFGPHRVDDAVALLLKAGFGGNWTAKMVQSRASGWKGEIF